jgi:hypothetical protein
MKDDFKKLWEQFEKEVKQYNVDNKHRYCFAKVMCNFENFISWIKDQTWEWGR